MKRRKPAPKPQLKSLKPKPKPQDVAAKTPIDLVRSPQYDTAMAAQRYDQMLADMVARAQAGQFDVLRDEVSQIPIQSVSQQMAALYPNRLPDQALTFATAGTMTGQGSAPSANPINPNTQAGLPQNFNQIAGQIPKFTMGSANPSSFQNFQNLVQNGVAQANLRNMYEALKPPFAEVGPARPVNPNPPTSQFGSGLGGVKKFF
jgi:hypothetical protein